MIYEVFSNLPSFKKLLFRPGLNILLSDKSPDATEKHTRNRAGKSSLIEMIHFLTGAQVNRDSIFGSESLATYTFGMDFDLGKVRGVVERSGQTSRFVEVSSEEFLPPPIQSRETAEGKYEISNTEWRRVLGSKMFGLGNQNADLPNKYAPTFRAAYSYFVRRQSSNAFIIPFKQSENQQLWDQQVAISFLLGLDWTIPQQWQLVRDQEKTLKELRKAYSEGTFGEIIGRAADLRTQLTVAEDRAQKLRDSIVEFKVLPDYRHFEAEATELSVNISDLENYNLIDQELNLTLQRALIEEEISAVNDLEQLYNEIGIILPDSVTKRFEEVRAFHESIIQNRSSYLTGELAATQERITTRTNQIRQKEERRGEILNILKSYGAIDHLFQLQSELVRHEVEVKNLRNRFQTAMQFEEKKAESEIERSRLLLRLQQDYVEQQEKLERAILAFERISDELYEAAGSLTIDPTQNGPEFHVTMPGSRSKGISNMQILCFDLAIMELCTKSGIGPGYLVHDSHLFDGVDERQVVKALEIGARMADQLGFQYIVTMNSDAMPNDISSDFRIDDYLLPTRLTDATEDGGLFGFRFN